MERDGSLSKRRLSIFSPSPSPPPPEDVDLKAFTSDNRHFSMVRQLYLADYITMLNCYCGFNAIISSCRYIASGHQAHTYTYRAMFFTFFGFFFDVFDGRVARWRNHASPMGKELDSLADLVTFGVAPATIAFSLGLDTTVDLLILTFFVLCGLLRLARFNVTAVLLSHNSGKVSHFEGIPIPSSLGAVLLMVFARWMNAVHENLPFGLVLENTVLRFHPIALLFFFWGSAMISKSLKLPKL